MGCEKTGRILLDSSRLSERAAELKNYLESKIVDQRRAIERVALAYEYWLSPLWVPERPIITALFLGPSGVGKTRLAEALAEFFFESRSALTKIECANFKERHEIAKLIGSPPGYVGYGEAPLLTQESIDRPAFDYEFSKFKEKDIQLNRINEEINQLIKEIEKTGDPKAKRSLEKELSRKFLNRNIYASAAMRNKRLISIVLFDEFEKGHESLRHFLLEIASHGRTRLGTGEEVTFYNSFVILTSNVASRVIAGIIQNRRGVIGFTSEVRWEGSDKEQLVYESAIKELRQNVEPEFLGRIEKDIVIFKPLSREQLAEIRDRNITAFIIRLTQTHPIELIVSSAVKNFILERALDHPEYGARLILDKIEKYLTNPIFRMINSGQINIGDRVFADLEGEGIVFSKDPGPKLLFPSSVNGEEKK